MVTSLIAKGKDQGYLLSDDIMAAFPNPEEQLDNLDDFYSALVAEGIDVLDQRPEPVKAVRSLRERARERAESRAAEDALAGGVGDSVRLYLQEIGETN